MFSLNRLNIGDSIFPIREYTKRPGFRDMEGQRLKLTVVYASLLNIEVIYKTY